MELFERDDVETHLRALLPGAGRGGALALVGGEAGVGKTAFVRHVARRLEGRAELLWGDCDPLGVPQPLAPVLDFAPRLLGASANELAVDGSRRDLLFRALLDRLSDGPVRLVVIEDVHWADDATLDVLRFLGRRMAQTRALLVCTYREDALGPEHPVRVLLGHLAGMPSVHRLELAPLSPDAVRAMCVGTDLDPVELHRRSGGNPFYVTEVIAAAGGAAGGEGAPGRNTHAVPATVRDAVLARAAGLEAEARAVLEAAAVLGARAEPWLVEALLGDAETGIDRCLASGMLEYAGDALTFRHELARDAIDQAMSPEHRRRLHAAVLRALETYPDRRIDVARMAHHADNAHDGAAVLVYAPEAGRQAARLGAHREAARQYARALRFGAGLEEAERAALLEAFAQARRVLGHTREVLEAQEEAARLWHEVGDVRAEGAALARLAGIYVHRGRNDDAERASRRSLELLRSLPPSRELGHAQVVQAALRMRARDNEAAVAWGRRALGTAERFADVELAVRAHCRIAAGLLLLEDAAGEEHLERARRLAQDAGLVRVIALPDVTAASISGEYHRFEEARRMLLAGIATCREHDLDSDADYLQAWLALTDLHLGAWRASAEVAGEIVRRTDAEAISRILALVALGRLRARRGDSGAREVLDEALALAERTHTLQRLGPVRTARAEEAWLAGDLQRCNAEAASLYPQAIEHRHPWFAGELGYWLRRAGSDVDLPEWTAAPFRLEADGAYEEAAAAWHARSCPYEEARALARSGSERALKRALTLFEDLGAHPAAAAAARALRQLGARAIPRGPRPSTRAHPAGLTPREDQVLQLLARGLTNRGVAAALHISPKTAGHHVSSILAKLDVHGRTEAVSEAHRRGLLGDARDRENGEPT